MSRKIYFLYECLSISFDFKLKIAFFACYNIQFLMPKSESENDCKKNKSIKNIYIHKINSLIKIMGDSHASLPCRTKVRKTISSQSREGWLLKRKENNKDAARKARLRKKIYMELLEQSIKNMQQLNEQGKLLEKASNQLLESLKNERQCKQQDEISQYLMQVDFEKVKKDASQATMDMQKQGGLNKIAYQIEKIMFPREWSLQKLETIKQSSQNMAQLSKMRSIQQQLPELFIDLVNICSDHASLSVLTSSSKNQANVDPYFRKTLLEEYYSKTLCRKDATGTEVQKYLNVLVKMEEHCMRTQQMNE